MIEIIPAIDIINGNCVRLTKGDFNAKTIYNEDPTEIAKQFQDAGLKRLHLVDLDGARSGSIQNLKVLESIASATELIVDFGGGISKIGDVNDAFNAGASLITVGSLAVKNKELFIEWLAQFGAEKFLLGADVKNNNILIKGWTESTNINIHAFIDSYTKEGVINIFCTDISKDGMLEGPSVELYKSILAKNKLVQLIASGGVTSCKDIDMLDEIGCKGVIIGKAIYEGLITLEELKHYVD